MIYYEGFKTTVKNKQKVARIIKDELKGKDYFECYVIYNVESEEFDICPTYMMEKLEYMGYVKYKLFTHSAVDGKMTIKQIIDEIFTYQWGKR